MKTFTCNTQTLHLGSLCEGRNVSFEAGQLASELGASFD